MTRLGLTLTRRSPLVAVALAAALAASCAVGPNYERPQMPVPPAYRFFEGEAQAESLADVPWWEVVKDPQLQALIREAIANNLDLRMATARVTEARAQYGIAKSFLFPEVGFAGGYSAQQISRLSEPPQGTAGPEDVPELERRLPDLLGDRPLRPDPAGEGGGVRRLPRHRGGTPGGPHHARGGRGVHLPLPPGAGPAARRRPAHGPDERGDGAVLREAAEGRRLEPARGRHGDREPGPHGHRHPPARAADRGRRERAQLPARAAAGPDRARRGAHATSTSRRGSPSVSPPPSSSGARTCSRPSSSSWPRTPTSARRRPSSSRRSRSTGPARHDQRRLLRTC